MNTRTKTKAIPQVQFFKELQLSTNYVPTRQVWRWRVRAANGLIITTSGEAFKTFYNARRSFQNVRRVLRAPKIKFSKVL